MTEYVDNAKALSDHFKGRLTSAGFTMDVSGIWAREAGRERVQIQVRETPQRTISPTEIGIVYTDTNIKTTWMNLADVVTGNEKALDLNTFLAENFSASRSQPGPAEKALSRLRIA